MFLMNKDIHTFACDVETTGLSEYKYGIWQVAYSINGGNIKEKKMCPPDGALYDSKALETGGVTQEEIQDMRPAKEVFVEILSDLNAFISPYNKTQKFHFIGYNALFDMKFMRSFFYNMNCKWFGSYFWFPPIDVMILAAEYLKDRRAYMPNFKLMTVAEKLGIEIEKEKLHDASYDIELTIEIYRIITQQQPNNMEEKQDGRFIQT